MEEHASAREDVETDGIRGMRLRGGDRDMSATLVPR